MTKLRESSRSFFAWFRLLVYAEPSVQDVSLLICGIITAIASGLPIPVLGIVFGQLMDDLNTASCSTASDSPAARSSLQSDINDKVLIVIYIALANLVLIYVYIVSWNLFGERLAQRMREKYLRSMLHKDVQFFDHMAAGEISNHLNSDIDTIKEGTSKKVGIVINAASFFTVAYTIAFIKNARLGGILVSLTPAFLLMSLVGAHFVGKYFSIMSTKIASASAIALEALSNITVVHALGANAKLEGRFTALLDDAKKAGIGKSVTISLQAGLLFFIAYSANATAYFVGSRQIADAVERDGGTTVGEIYTVVFILVDATIILSTVAPFLQLFGAAQSAFVKLEEIMEAKCEDYHRSAASADGIIPSLELQNVSFAYPSRPNVQALKDVSLLIPAGKHTAIVGLSGSGKSTIASTLLRLYEVSHGNVLLGSIPITQLSLDVVRSQMSFVQQEATLFDRSILENIALGLVSSQNHQHLSAVLRSGDLSTIARRIRDGEDMLHASKQGDQGCKEIVILVKQAAIEADADRFIQGLQGGYGTVVGSRGSLISGGQKQRIALARALVKKPKILILDEATGSLDSLSEQRIQAALNSVSLGRTTVTIAHRLSTVQAADNIVVMNAGQITEQGTHEELMAYGGAYSELVRLQHNSQQDLGTRTKTSHVPLTLRDDECFGSEHMVESKDSSIAEAADIQPVQLGEQGLEHTNLDPDIAIQRSAFFVLKSLSSTFRPSILILVIALVAVLLVGSTYSAAAIIFGNTVGALSPCKTPSSIRSSGAFFASMFFVLAVVEFFANVISWSGFGLVSERALLKIRILAFRSLIEQDLQWHESANRTPKSLLSLVTTDGDALGGLTGSTLGTMLSISVNMVAAIVLTHIVAWKIALVCLAVVPLIIGSGTMHLIVLARFATKHAEAFTNSVGIAVEAVESIKTIAALSLQDEILHTYRRSLKKPVKETTKQALYADMWLALAYGIPTFLYALSFWWGSTLLITGEYTQVEYYICTIALLVSAQLWGQLFTIAPDVSKAFAAVQRIVNLINLGSKSSGDDKPSSTISPSVACSGGNADEKTRDAEKCLGTNNQLPVHLSQTVIGASINFTDVRFSYPARPHLEVLKGVSFHIEPGQFCAVVGPSGAGKSTIISLLERMYRPCSGTVVIDGTDITCADISFRNSIAYVPQDSILFDGSIRFNMELGARPDQAVTEADIERACRLASIHEKIASLPDGYDTHCGSGGNQLSGGEKQRVAIARALIRRPKLLLLDESTSALDAESEHALKTGLDQARNTTGMTIVAIAHRLHTIMNADVIFVVDGGRVLDRGRHADLMERCETYRTNALHQGF